MVRTAVNVCQAMGSLVGRSEEAQNSHLNGAGLAVEPVGHEDLVLVVVVAGGEDVGALDGLVEEAEDVEDDDDGLGGVLGAGDICRRGLRLAQSQRTGGRGARDLQLSASWKA